MKKKRIIKIIIGLIIASAALLIINSGSKRKSDLTFERIGQLEKKIELLECELQSQSETIERLERRIEWLECETGFQEDLLVNIYHDINNKE